MLWTYLESSLNSCPVSLHFSLVSQTGPLAMRRVLAADATYLKSSFSLKLYNLATRRVISRLRLTPLPVSDAVIHAVETIAKSEGQGSLKITSPGGNVINDSRLNAGVSHHKYDTDNATNEENDNDEDDCTNVDIETIHPESDRESEENDTIPNRTAQTSRNMTTTMKT
jgi:hypothetical protein